MEGVGNSKTESIEWGMGSGLLGWTKMWGRMGNESESLQ